jgi:hypothetical protein
MIHHLQTDNFNFIPMAYELSYPILVDFQTLIGDSNQIVKKASLSTFSSIAHNKPDLIKNLLGQVLPVIYSSTKIDVINRLFIFS